jgi:oligopeptide transport system permease protein
MLFIPVPSFIVITLLMLWLCYQNRILPSQFPSQSADGFTQFKGYIIPTMALSFGSICGYCRFTRAELTEVMSSDFLLLARTKGLTRSQAIVRHALKNAFVPILPSILAEVIALLGGAMILEQLYGIPGVGKLYVTALNQKDYNVLMADMGFYTIIGLISGVFLDLSYGFIDPRIRMGARK